MLRPYETVLIITPVLSEGELKKKLEKYTNLLKKAGAEMTHEEDWGLKPLAYEIKNKSTGYYHIYEYSTTPDAIGPFEVELSRDEEVLRFLTSKLDKFAVDYNDKKRKGLIGRKDKPEEVAAAAEKQGEHGEHSKPVEKKAEPIKSQDTSTKEDSAQEAKATKEPTTEAPATEEKEAATEKAAEAKVEAEDTQDEPSTGSGQDSPGEESKTQEA